MTVVSRYAEPGRADRNIALRNRPDLKPVEERMNIVSNRVIDTEPNSNTTVRLESGLEAGLLTILKVEPGIVSVRAQYKVRIMVEGIWVDHWFDACADFDTGCRVLYAVRNKENAAAVNDLVGLFREQELDQHAHFALLMDEDEISKPAIYRAEEILLARQRNNERVNDLVLRTLQAAGGRERVANVLTRIPGVTFARAWNAMWSLIDRGLVAHDHPRPEKTIIKRHSWIIIVKEQENDE